MAVNDVTANIVSLSNLAVINPQKDTGYQEQSAQRPPGSQGPTLNGKSYLFHIEGENSISLESDITDSYVETNYAINDHIALRPERVTVQGFIGELNDIFPVNIAGFGLNFLKTKLTQLAAYEPAFSATQLINLNTTFLYYQVLANTASTIGQGISLFSKDYEYLTKQSYFFGLFYTAWRNRVLYTVQTPWRKFDDMAIESLRAIQDANTRMISDFEITFKKLRFIDTQLSNEKYADTVKQGQLAGQASAVQNQGENALQQSSVTFTGVLDSIRGL
jgi:hypothetical protein